MGDEDTTPCAYCRTPVLLLETCFLCLDSDTDQPCEKTICYHISVHSSLVDDKIYISEQMESILFECGVCGCIWTHTNMDQVWYINLNDFLLNIILVNIFLFNIILLNTLLVKSLVIS